MSLKNYKVTAEYFDRARDRRSSDSLKWNTYEPDVLPMWVADMDFASPEPVIHALQERINHGIFGYGIHPRALVDTILERLERLYHWAVSAEAVSFVPGVVVGFNLAARALRDGGGRLLIQTPVYPPILHAARNAGLVSAMNELVCGPDNRYEIDFLSFEAAAEPGTRAFLLCNPHNPVGRVFRADELERMAEICLRRGIVIISDEIHCDLLYSGQVHVPVATLDPEIARRTITLMSPSKTFNIAGLEGAVAVIPDLELRQRFERARADLVPGISLLAAAAALAAYREGQPWLDALLPYLEANRDFLLEFASKRLPGIRMTKPEGTYLAWLDCRHAGLPGKPAKFFLKEGRVASNPGESFGPGGEGFVRLNFGCSRSTLEEGLRRMAAALARPEGFSR
jgi:cystathionine beta-lyase